MKLKMLKYSFISFISVLAILITIYVGTSVYIGAQIYRLVDSSFQSKGKDYEQYTELIARINYQYLDYSNGCDQNWKKNYHSFPLVIHDFKTARASYVYTIEGTNFGAEKSSIYVWLEFQNGKWRITSVGWPSY